MNRNTLVRRYPFVDGVKTGHTLRAGYVLVGAAHAPGAEIVSVVMGTPSEYARDSDSLALLRWGAAQFTRVAPVHAGRRYGRAAVRWRDGETAALVAARPVRLTVRRGERTALKVDAPRRLQGPLRRGSRVGTLAVVLRGRVVARVPLVTASAVRGVSFLQRATGPLGGPLAALALVALVGTMALLGRRMARTNRGMRRQRAG
jgi:D-alanyl-D-alanine carboxypeptidase (penicillin-binding protein 5/6)